MTGALQEPHSTPELFPVRDRRAPLGRSGNNRRSQFHELLIDSTSRHEQPLVKPRQTATPKSGQAILTAKIKASSLEPPNQSNSSPKLQTDMPLGNESPDSTKPLQLLDQTKETAESLPGELPVVANTTETSAIVPSLQSKFILNSAAPVNVDENPMPNNADVQTLVSPLMQVPIAPAIPVPSESSEALPVKEKAVERAIQFASKPAIGNPAPQSVPVPAPNRQSEAAEPPGGVNIDGSWTIQSVTGDAAPNKSDPTLPVAFSIELATQAKSEQPADLLRLRVHVPTKTTDMKSISGNLKSESSLLATKDSDSLETTITQISVTKPATQQAESNPFGEQPNRDRHANEDDSRAKDVNIITPFAEIPESNLTGKVTADHDPPAVKDTLQLEESSTPSRKNVAQVVLHLEQGDQARIAVRVQSSASGVRMDVQGDNPQLRSSLRDSLSNLERTLEAQGVSSTLVAPGNGFGESQRVGTPLGAQSQQDSNSGAARDGRNQKDQTPQGGSDDPRRRRQPSGNEMASIGSWSNTIFQGAKQ